jgi:DNA-damage-inducible protein J
MKYNYKEHLMAKTAAISMRIDPKIKSEAESIFGNFGLTLAEAINVFLHKSIMEGGLPFEVRQPRYNAETEKAIQEARDIISGKVKARGYDSIDAMFADLDK